MHAWPLGFDNENKIVCKWKAKATMTNIHERWIYSCAKTMLEIGRLLHFRDSFPRWPLTLDHRNAKVSRSLCSQVPLFYTLCNPNNHDCPLENALFHCWEEQWTRLTDNTIWTAISATFRPLLRRRGVNHCFDCHSSRRLVRFIRLFGNFSQEGVI